MLPKAWSWIENYAKAKERLVIGLISGTSADGVDAALVKIVGREPDRVETIAFTTKPYPTDIRETVLRVSHNGDVETLCWLNFVLGEIFAEAALEVIKVAGVSAKRVSLIGSHGQTVRHLPPKPSSPVKLGHCKLLHPLSSPFGRESLSSATFARRIWLQADREHLWFRSLIGFCFGTVARTESL